MRILAFTLGVLLLLMYILVGDASGDIYTWVDRDGQVHFTDDYSAVPPEYRDRAQSRPSSPPSEPLQPLELPKTSKKGKPSKGKLSKSPPPRLPSSGGASKVVAVVDGDTIIITGGDKVRYAGLNTPESRHPDKLPEYCGQEAFEANRRLVSDKTVR